MSRITDEQLDEANRVLRADYYSDVRSTARDTIERMAASYTDLHDDIHETADGSQWVIYTAKSLQCLLASDEWTAIDDDEGRVEASLDEHVTRAAFHAYRGDLQAQVTAELGTDPSDWSDDDWAAFKRFLDGKPTDEDIEDHDEQLNAAEQFRQGGE